MSDQQRNGLVTEFDSRIEHLPESVDRAAVERMRVVAHVLDDSIRVPGTEFRIGLDPFVSAIPVAGDVVSAGFSAYIVLEAARLGVSYTTLLAMIANVTLDVVGGSIPYVGDVFDALWKTNKRNLELVLDDITSDPDRSRQGGRDPVEIEVD